MTVTTTSTRRFNNEPDHAEPCDCGPCNGFPLGVVPDPDDESVGLCVSINHKPCVYGLDFCGVATGVKPDCLVWEAFQRGAGAGYADALENARRHGLDSAVEGWMAATGCVLEADIDAHEAAIAAGPSRCDSCYNAGGDGCTTACSDHPLHVSEW